MTKEEVSLAKIGDLVYIQKYGRIYQIIEIRLAIFPENRILFVESVDSARERLSINSVYADVVNEATIVALMRARILEAETTATEQINILKKSRANG